MNDQQSKRCRRIEVVEINEIPRLDILFGFGPTVPFVAGAVLAWWLPQPSRMIALQLVGLWGSAILLFLSGVRRGLSFRTERGPTWSQIVTMLALFCMGLGALAALLIDALLVALLVLLAGFGAVVVLDPIAAHRGEAPLYFSKLRRLQMPIVLVALIVSVAIAART
jgi:uncharacterized protein DUF3429